MLGTGVELGVEMPSWSGVLDGFGDLNLCFRFIGGKMMLRETGYGDVVVG